MKRKEFLIKTKIITGEQDVIDNTIEYLTVDVDECAMIESTIVKNIGELSDGYHSFNELYFHRMILFSVICNANPQKAWKSWQHSDGTMFDDYFVVGITTDEGDYSYHYHMENWDYFKVKELDYAPVWDGHKPSDVGRLLSLV